MTGQQVMARLRERDGDGEILRLVHCIAKQHDVTIEEMLGETRQASPCAARQQLWYELYITGRWSYPRLAQTFGRQSHETIILGVRSHCGRAGLAAPRQGMGKRYVPPGEAFIPQATGGEQ